MAVQVNNLCGFENYSSTYFQALATANTPTFDTTTPLTGTACLALVATEQFDLPWMEKHDVVIAEYERADQGSGWIIGFRLQKSGNPATGPDAIVTHADDGDDTVWTIELNSSGQLLLIDDAATTLDTSTALSNDTEYYIEVYWTSAGAWEWFIDGTSEGSGSGADFTTTGSINKSAYLRFAGFTGYTARFDDAYIKSGCTAATDREGGTTAVEAPEVFYYTLANDSNGQASEWIGDGSKVSGAPIDGGDWSSCSIWPDGSNNGARMEEDTSGGSVRASAFGVEISNNITALMGNFNMSRGAGSSANTDLYLGKNDLVATSAVWRGKPATPSYFGVFVSGVSYTSANTIRFGFARLASGSPPRIRLFWAEALHIPAAAGSAGSAVAVRPFSLLLLGVGMPDR